jgi:hypothetical protein
MIFFFLITTPHNKKRIEENTEDKIEKKINEKK